MQTIFTKVGRYSFEPIELYHGRSKINKAIAKTNLLDFREIVLNTPIRWGLVYGTLLGAVREGDFISHDEDTDVFIFYEDKEALLSLLFEFHLIGFRVARYQGSLLSIIRDNEYIDFYFFKKTLTGRRSGRYFIPSKFFNSSDKINFFDQVFPTVSEYKEFLEYTYGNDWKTPKQGCHAEGKPIIWKETVKKHLPLAVCLYKLTIGRLAKY